MRGSNQGRSGQPSTSQQLVIGMRGGVGGGVGGGGTGRGTRGGAGWRGVYVGLEQKQRKWRGVVGEAARRGGQRVEQEIRWK